MPTAQEIYATTIRQLPPAERLRLAALILDELVRADILRTDESDVWSEEDVHDLQAYSLRHAAASYPEKEVAFSTR